MGKNKTEIARLTGHDLKTVAKVIKKLKQVLKFHNTSWEVL